MGWLKKLGLGPQDAAEAVMDVAEGTADIVERWKPSEKAKHDMREDSLEHEAKHTQEAREYDPRTTGTNVFSEWINVTVDALNRLIRPGCAILLIGGTFGLWDLAVTTTDPVVLGWTEAVVGFYFGVRAVTQDIPRLLEAIKKLRKSNGSER